MIAKYCHLDRSSYSTHFQLNDLMAICHGCIESCSKILHGCSSHMIHVTHCCLRSHFKHVLCYREVDSWTLNPHFLLLFPPRAGVQLQMHLVMTNCYQTEVMRIYLKVFTVPSWTMLHSYGNLWFHRFLLCFVPLILILSNTFSIGLLGSFLYHGWSNSFTTCFGLHFTFFLLASRAEAK